MIGIRIMSAICVMGLFQSAVADQPQNQAVEFLQNWIAQIKGEEPLPPVNPGVPSIKCGTPAFVALSAYAHLNMEAALPAQIARPSNLPYTYGTDHFLIHYTTSGMDSVYRPGVDSIPGIPTHVTRTAEVLEHVWNVEVDSLGYRSPLADFGNGGDNRYDVYFVNLGLGLYGFTAPESTLLSNGVYIATSFIEIENDFAENPHIERTRWMRSRLPWLMNSSIQFS